MKGKFVKYSKKTARNNQMMIIREFDRVIKKQEDNIKNLVDKIEQMEITVSLKQEASTKTGHAFSDNMQSPPKLVQEFKTKLSDLVINANAKKNTSYHYNANEKRYFGIEALRWLYNTQKNSMLEMIEQKKILLDMKEEKTDFILKYTV